MKHYNVVNTSGTLTDQGEAQPVANPGFSGGGCQCQMLGSANLLFVQKFLKAAQKLKKLNDGGRAVDSPVAPIFWCSLKKEAQK